MMDNKESAFKIFEIESREFDGAYRNEITRYRFYSLYNSCRGGWCSTKEEAENEGKRHQEIIERFYNTLE